MSDDNYELLECLDDITKALWEANSHNARRERIATAALQGMLAGSSNWIHDAEFHHKHQQVAAVAVCYADALIAKLDKPT